MTPADFDYLRALLRERSGLVLSAEKQYLAESRLLPVARRNGMTTLTELIGKIKATTLAPLAAEVVEAMTTNETFFFRVNKNAATITPVMPPWNDMPPCQILKASRGCSQYSPPL